MKKNLKWEQNWIKIDIENLKSKGIKEQQEKKFLKGYGDRERHRKKIIKVEALRNNKKKLQNKNKEKSTERHTQKISKATGYRIDKKLKRQTENSLK